MNKPDIDIKKMRSGEKVKCPDCENGYISNPDNKKDAHYFVCNCCGLKINID